MNGAEALVRTLVGAGVDVCFANPGTSEMHFVAALDRVEGMRCVLGLFEGVGDRRGRRLRPHGRQARRDPAAPRARARQRARQPAQRRARLHADGQHRRRPRHLPPAYDAPLTSDIEAVARPFSHWVRMGTSAASVAADAADAIAAARNPPGQIATLILPADVAWSEAPGGAAPPRALAVPEPVDADAIRRAAAILRSGEPAALLMTGRALRAANLDNAGRIAAATGARLLSQTSNARVERGAGRVAVDRVPYPVDIALKFLAGLKHLMLVGAKAPVAFFAYPEKPSELTPADCEILCLARPGQDLGAALAALADELGAARAPVPAEALSARRRPATGRSRRRRSRRRSGALLPENAIVVDEAITVGRAFYGTLRGAPPHDWLQLTGGAIGDGLPMATGAAVACPDRPVLCLEADGSAMYTVQSLWTQARENLNVTTLIMNNRSYAILRGELANVGAQNVGPKAIDMLSLDRPDIDWVPLARAMGVEGFRASTIAELSLALEAGLASRGPALIDVVL